MIAKIRNALVWLPGYWQREAGLLIGGRKPPKHVYFSICDHYEPYWNAADKRTAKSRLTRWLDEWPKLADAHLDSTGQKLKYSFFYPEEEYQHDDMAALASLCHAGYGEVEIHLHHDNDTEENLRRTLVDFRDRLRNEHGLLSEDRRTGKIVYSFIHGNWALNNSHPKKRMCGVNDETAILLDTGCYADLTLPSAPDPCQTKKVNSIYYAKPASHPKAHDEGGNVRCGVPGEGLLMIQGPLGLSWSRRKWGCVPRVENGGLMASTPITLSRAHEWINIAVHVEGAPEHVFVKLYAHGTQEKNIRSFFDEGGGGRLLDFMKEATESCGADLHFVSAREMANVILAIESGNASPQDCIDFRYK